MSVTLFTILRFMAFSGVESAPTSADTRWVPPVGNKTAMYKELAPSWVPEPPGRGTCSLLYSCLFTLFLCVYTAIHMNIPRTDESKFTPYIRHAKWVRAAIFMPELVLCTAFAQWDNAGICRDVLNSRLKVILLKMHGNGT